MNDIDAHDDDENIPRRVEQIFDEQKEMRRLSCLPLYMEQRHLCYVLVALS